MSHSNSTEKPIITTRSAVLFGLLIIGLLIATANFIKAMSHSESHGEAATETTHATTPAHDTHAQTQAASGDTAHHNAATASHADTAKVLNGKDTTAVATPATRK